MKLVEILARELKEWPELTMNLSQCSDGEVVGHGITLGFMELACDFLDAVVTRSQWEAERARIAELDRGQYSLITTDATPEEWRNECQKQYEQELWDKVASNVIGSLSTKDWSYYRVMVEHSMEIADAFMEERAKRLKR